MKKWIVIYLFFFPLLSARSLVQDFNEQKFLRLVGEPEFFIDQIRSDLAPFSRGISRAFINMICAHDYFENAYLTKVMIRNGKLSFQKSNNAANSTYPVDEILFHFQNMHRIKPLPNMEFVFSCLDKIDHVHPADSKEVLPIFMVSDQKGRKDGIFMPDWSALRGYDGLKAKIDKASALFPWEKKIHKILWRGSNTGKFGGDIDQWKNSPRAQLIKFSMNHPRIMDAKFHYIFEPEIENQMRAQGYIGNRISEENHVRFCYLIDVEGNAATWPRTYWILLSNSLLLKVDSKYKQWFYDKLIPGMHYLPIKADLSDLISQLQWAERHPEECKAIARRSTEFANKHLYQEAVYAYMYHLLLEYAKLWRP